ncbi:hypothetical protein Dacet_2863 [Denitrovibrio acetiphilus DSM 12809]|uniref:Uncharacterized protein n=1 Tax=Denitrovibrio acetiphilus (strain DSM 12809 / NBRC 114555 / N2460) TaxID=522772 RepID=D4H6D9_DENA2|nr:hypothetical protein [Denitrovibrio acetiphilus]ADD69613.1 hypothetical protein Dacet_2863 [Denitrovibrio acetiphilus DSM 12809]
MNPMTLVGLAFLLICILFILLLIAISKINSLHKKITDVSPNDLYPFMEEMRELVIESERVADKLEDSVRQKEELLEDISSLIDEKLKRLESFEDAPPPVYKPQSGYSEDTYEPAMNHVRQPEKPKGTGIRDKISELVRSGLSDSDIASKLGVSVTEVQIVKRMDLG